jgi:hypothetical protein
MSMGHDVDWGVGVVAGAGRVSLPRLRRLTPALAALLLLTACGGGNSGSSPTPAPTPTPVSTPATLGYLTRVYDQYQSTVGVYLNSDDAGNAFAARGRFPDTATDAEVPPMDEAYADSVGAQGIDCIHARFVANGNNWGGWYLMNGYLNGTMVAPLPNWGDIPVAGVDVSGATSLTFYARGAVGGERVEFFCCGVGNTTGMPYPDSSPKVSLGTVTLAPSWTQYTIPLTGVDLHYVLGGFGWVATAADNGNQSIDFYLDQIQFNRSHPTDLRLPLSYRTILSTNPADQVLRNAAFVYDADVTLLALLANNDTTRARLLADSLVYAINNDRYYNKDGGIRSAYAAGGTLASNPGWTPNGKVGTARMPGWSDPVKGWLEDATQVNRDTGNTAWTAIALLSAYRVLGNAQYLTAAEGLAAWVETNCRDAHGAGGYTAGYTFGPGHWDAAPIKRTNKATEHNIDLYCVFTRLFAITQDASYQEHATHARQFVEAMWDSTNGRFYTGTTADGVSIDTSVIPLDIQAWSLLSLRDATATYKRSLDYVEAHHKVSGGYDFNEDRDGVWSEGTAQVACAYALLGNTDKTNTILAFLHANCQDPATNGVYAASIDGLTTGFLLADGSPWVYNHRLHIGATSWLAFAEASLGGLNPFYLGEPTVSRARLPASRR